MITATHTTQPATNGRAITDAHLAALTKWVNQRPGLDFGNYGNVAAYRAEVRSITKDRADFQAIARELAYRSTTHVHWHIAFRAFSGRLTPTYRDDGSISLAYCVGQYWPTEYRRAACAVIASVLWQLAREDRDDSTGDTLRDHFRSVFPRNVARRWFQ
jgi:hypothetical protein